MTLIIGPGGTGLTFLCWSILFLKGDTTYQTLDNQTVEVDINPLIGPVAHGFVKDHIQNSNDIAKLQHSHSGSMIYFVPSHQQDFDTACSYDCKKIVFDCQEHGPKIFARMMTCLPSGGLVQLEKTLSAQYGKKAVRSVLLEVHKSFTNYYTVPCGHDFYRINYDDVFVNLDQCVSKIFKFLNLSMDSSRQNLWLPIYNDYRQRNRNIYNDYIQDLIPVDSVVKRKIFKAVLETINNHY